MKKTVLALTLLLPGCAHGLDKSLDGVEKFAAGVDVAVTGSVNLWDAGIDAQIEFCKARGLGPQSSEKDLADCMGVFGQGKKAEPAFEKLVDGYDMLAKGLEMLREAQKELEPYLEAAEKVTDR